jgi:hypothetical protein
LNGKFYEILEGSTALIIFGGIILISALSVSALNPVAQTQSQPSVAGVQTEDQPSYTNRIPLVVSDLGKNDQEYHTTLTQDESEYTYLAKIEPIGATKRSYDFIKITNPNNFSSQIEATALVRGNVGNLLTVRVFDDVDTIVLVEKNSPGEIKNITVPANSERIFKVEYDLQEKVNFDFEVEFTFN